MISVKRLGENFLEDRADPGI